MKRKRKACWLEIELKSPLCAATGDGICGLVDVDIAHACGVPLIPAKRLYGCLRTSGEELAAYDAEMAAALDGLFGKTGAEKSAALQLEDAHLYKTPDFAADGENKPVLEIASYSNFTAELRQYLQMDGAAKADLQVKDVLDFFTSVRTRTAIDDASGIAKKTALYALRVAHKGLGFRARVTLTEDTEQDDFARALEKCARGLRHIGLGITRGFGEVRCALTPWDEEDLLQVFPLRSGNESSANETGVLRYALELDAPLLIAGQEGLYSTCEDCIPGSAVLGALARLYIAEKLPEDEKEKAHENDAFRAIFLQGRVKFGYAFPAVDAVQCFYPCPKLLQRDKKKERYYNAAQEILEEAQSCAELSCSKPLQQDKEKEKSKFLEDAQPCAERRLIAFSAEGVQVCELDKEIRMHHARPLDRGVGYAVRDEDAASGEDGQFFQYVSISAGQRFCGTLHGTAADLQLLVDCLRGNGNRLRLGRSRKTEYGAARFVPLGFEADVKRQFSSVPGCAWMALWFLTPVSLRDAAGRDSLDPQLLLAEMAAKLQCDLQLEQKFLGFAKLAGYNAKWRLPKQQKNVLAPGTVLLVKADCRIDPQAIEQECWGENTEEGCGKIKVLDEAFLKKEGYTEKEIKRVKPRPPFSERKEIAPREAKHALIRALLEWKQAKVAAYKEKKDAFDEERIGTLESTAIAQLLRCLNELDAETEDICEALLREVKKLGNEQKKRKIEAFLQPCEKKSRVFIETYLQRAKWKARRMYVEHTANGEGKETR